MHRHKLPRRTAQRVMPARNNWTVTAKIFVRQTRQAHASWRPNYKLPQLPYETQNMLRNTTNHNIKPAITVDYSIGAYSIII